MLLYDTHAAKNGHQKTMIQKFDTEIVVLAVAVARILKPGHKVWLAFGTGKNFDILLSMIKGRLETY